MMGSSREQQFLEERSWYEWYNALVSPCIVDGDVPDGFTHKRFRHSIPDDWDEQQSDFGFL